MHLYYKCAKPIHSAFHGTDGFLLVEAPPQAPCWMQSFGLRLRDSFKSLWMLNIWNTVLVICGRRSNRSFYLRRRLRRSLHAVTQNPQFLLSVNCGSYIPAVSGCSGRFAMQKQTTSAVIRILRSMNSWTTFLTQHAIRGSAFSPSLVLRAGFSVIWKSLCVRHQQIMSTKMKNVLSVSFLSISKLIGKVDFPPLPNTIFHVIA